MAAEPRIYYRDAFATLWHGDCRAVLPTLPPGSVGAVVTDPPYGIDYGRAGGFSATHGWGKWRENVEWDKERAPKEAIEAILGLAVPTVIWGGNYFTDWLPPSMGWIAWDKGQREFSLADFELAWTSENKAARCVIWPRGKAVRDGKFHPTQKPVCVMVQCIQYLQRGREKRLDDILDPFAGSGSTLRAAKDLGCKSVGIEVHEPYCEIAANRLAQGVLEFTP
jgi:DNA modification methylase